MARHRRDPLEAVIAYFETEDIVKAQMALTTVQYLLKARSGPPPALVRQRQPKATSTAKTPSHSVPGIPLACLR